MDYVVLGIYALFTVIAIWLALLSENQRRKYENEAKRTDAIVSTFNKVYTDVLDGNKSIDDAAAMYKALEMISTLDGFAADEAKEVLDKVNKPYSFTSVLGIDSDQEGKFSANQVYDILHAVMGTIEEEHDRKQFIGFLKALKAKEATNDL